jgi:hypothetical protein
MLRRRRSGFPAAGLQLIGTTWAHNEDSGANLPLYPLVLPVGSQVGDRYMLIHYGDSNVDQDETSDVVNVLATGDIPRVSATVGENVRTALKHKALTATDIANNYIRVDANLRPNRGAIGIVFRNWSEFIGDGSTTTESSFADNSIAIQQETATDEAIALAMACRGNGTRTVSLPGWTLQAHAQHSASTGANAAGLAVFSKEIGPGLSPAGVMAFSGSANMTLRAWTIIVQ